LQVVANPETHLSQGGIFGGTDNKDKIVTESNGTFTITNKNPTINQQVISETSNTQTQLQVSIGAGTQQTFTVADTIQNPGQITLHDQPIPENVSATLTATKVSIETSTAVIQGHNGLNLSQPSVVTPPVGSVATESITFYTRQTQAAVEAAVDLMPIIKKNIGWFIRHLSAWLL